MQEFRVQALFRSSPWSVREKIYQKMETRTLREPRSAVGCCYYSKRAATVGYRKERCKIENVVLGRLQSCQYDSLGFGPRRMMGEHTDKPQVPTICDGTTPPALTF
jgi:hypothetical protein